MSDALKILAISGSLRAGSLNTRLLEAAVELVPSGMTVELYEGLGEIPHYNADLDGAATPPAVVDLRSRIVPESTMRSAGPPASTTTTAFPLIPCAMPR